MRSVVMIYIPRFMKTDKGVEGILRFSSAIRRAVMLVLLMEGIHEVCRWNGLRWHAPGSMTIDSGI
jgi:hypothetical protein